MTPPLVEGVRRFQRRHGLSADGVVGPDTLAELNTGVQKRIAQIKLNLVRWYRLKEYFPFRLRQEPSASNALGQFKFMFPNRFSVYIHDTPAKSLFSRNNRSFSSGCVHIEDPMALADYLEELSASDGARPTFAADLMPIDRILEKRRDTAASKAAGKIEAAKVS